MSSLRDPTDQVKADGASEQPGDDVGKRLREARLRKRLTLKVVADRAHLSESFLSQLERGFANGSVASLRRIAEALDLTIAELFEPAMTQSVRLVRRNERPGLLFGVLGHKYLLTPKPLENLEVFIGEFEPGGSTGDETYSHGDSDELFFVIAGDFSVQLGTELYTLGAGDCISYRSSVAHKATNVGLGQGEVMWAISPPSY